MSEKKKQKRKVKPQKFLFANVTRTKYPAVRQALKEQGWKFTESVTKNTLFWGDCEGSLETVRRLEDWQFYNHFPGMWRIAHKVELVRNYDRMQKALPEIYNFHPKSFILPFQLSDMKTHFAGIPKRAKRTFIIKPDKGAQGKGIFMIQDLDDISDYTESAVAQEYISPLLIDGFKFDLRIYVLVTSVDPLRLYIHREGMARFCTEKYSPPRARNLEHCYAHLTNFSLNKKSANFTENSKRSLTSVMRSIREQTKISTDGIMDEIDRIIRLTLISNQPLLSANYHTSIKSTDGKSRLFEILGFDILLDDQGKPWLLEVNSMPSLSCGSPFDTELKSSVINGALKILDLTPDFKRKCIARSRRESTQRMSGIGELPVSIFDPNRESEVARSTNWRQIYPLEDDQIMDECKHCLEMSKDIPVGGIIETATTRMRREAVMAQINRCNSAIPPARPKLVRETVSARPKVAKMKPPSQQTSLPKVQPEKAKEETTRSGTNTKTPRYLVLANESIRPRRMKSPSHRSSYAYHTEIMQIFEGCQPKVISDLEERQRLKTMRIRSDEIAGMKMKTIVAQYLSRDTKRSVSASTPKLPVMPVTKTQLMKLAIPNVGTRIQKT